MLLPNLLSFSRIPVAILFVIFLATEQWIAMWLTAAFGAWTDWADGHYARRNDEVTELGVIADPVADKIGIAIIVTSMWFLGYLPTYLFALVVGRDVLIVSAVAWYRYRYPGASTPMSDIYGKVAICAIALGMLLHLTPYWLAREWMIMIAVFVSLTRYGYRMYQLSSK
ncbi:MAG: CDP-alcohol phosphatidyltransferase family protein [Patescibacteria group bacterium]